MGKRCCFVIGVAKHDHSEFLSDLPGTLKDSNTYFKLLTDSNIGFHDNDLSILLQSPSLQEVRAAMAKVGLKDGIESFTFVFSGHGAFLNDTYYMCLRDTSPENLSLTALPMTDLMMYLSEKKFSETNIIIDSCNSGGAIDDFSRYLSSRSFGVANSMSVTCLAGAFRGEPAYENEHGGVLSTEIFKILNGETKISERDEFHDLLKISSYVSKQIGKLGKQQPIYWAAGCTGQSFFAKNGHFDSSSTITDAIMELFPNRHENREKFKEYQNDISRIYHSLNGQFEIDNLLILLKKIDKEIEDEVLLVSFLKNLKEKLWVGVVEQDDFGVGFDLLNAFSLVTIKLKNEKIKEVLWEDLQRTYLEFFNNFFEWIKTNKNEKYLLLEDSDGFAGWYLVPMRFYESLSIIGTFLTFKHLNKLDITDEEKSIIQEYFNLHFSKIRIVSDQQVVFLANFISGLQSCNIEDIITDVHLRFIINQLLDEDCILLHCKATEESIKKFVFYKAYRSEGAEIPYGCISNPTIFLAFTIILCSHLNYSQILDEFLWELDGKSCRIFVPNSYKDFGKSMIEDGTNIETSIGRNLFTFEDCDLWVEGLVASIASANQGLDGVEQFSAMVLASLYGDRQYLGFLNT